MNKFIDILIRIVVFSVAAKSEIPEFAELKVPWVFF